MHPRVRGVDIGQLKAQTFTQTQAEAIEGEEEHPVAEHAGGGEKAPRLLYGDDVGKSWARGGLISPGTTHGLRRTCMVKNFNPYRSSLTVLQECEVMSSLK